jgi:hypothetical protein
MAFGPLTAFMPQKQDTQIESGFMPQDALSAPTSAEQLDRLRNKVAPDEEGSSLSLIKQAKDRLLAQSTGVDPLISWLAAYGSADPRNKLGAAAQAMTQAVGQQAASKQKLDLDVLQLDMAAAGKREAIAAKAIEDDKALLAKAEAQKKEIAAEEKRDREKIDAKADEAAKDRQNKIDIANLVNSGKTKRVPAKVLDSFAKAGKSLDVFSDLENSFTDDFGGSSALGIPSEKVGNLENWLGSTGVIKGNQPQADWWRIYDKWAQEVRNDLFGASLTKTEKADFDKVKLNPSSSASTIRKELQRQKAIVARAIAKESNAYINRGIVDEDDVFYATGRSISDILEMSKLIPETQPVPDDEQEQYKGFSGTVVPNPK